MQFNGFLPFKQKSIHKRTKNTQKTQFLYTFKSIRVLYESRAVSVIRFYQIFLLSKSSIYPLRCAYILIEATLHNIKYSVMEKFIASTHCFA